MSNHELDELLALASEIIDNPDDHSFQPVLILQILVALTKEVRASRE